MKTQVIALLATFDALIAQDAWHYAAVLAGRPCVWEGDSHVDHTVAGPWRKCTDYAHVVAKRTFALMMADCARLGVSLVHLNLRRRSIRDMEVSAQKVLTYLTAVCTAHGVDGETGLTLEELAQDLAQCGLPIPAKCAHIALPV